MDLSMLGSLGRNNGRAHAPAAQYRPNSTGSGSSSSSSHVHNLTFAAGNGAGMRGQKRASANGTDVPSPAAGDTGANGVEEVVRMLFTVWVVIFLGEAGTDFKVFRIQLNCIL